MKKLKQKKEKIIKIVEGEINKQSFIYKTRSGYKVDEDALAHSLITKHKFRTIFSKKCEEIYVFDGKMYNSEKARSVIKTEVEKICGEYSKNQIVNEVFEKIKRLTESSREDFDNIPLHIIPLNNGLFNLKSRRLSSFNPEFPFRFIHPVNFDKNADCPNFKKFLDDSLYEQDILVVQELFGFALYRSYFIKKGFLFVGERDTGKTILLNVLIRFVGDKNISGITLQRISAEDKFAMASMYEKNINCYDDLRNRDISDGGGFKVATGGGWITAEFKFGDSFVFKNYAKQVFACNKIPPIKDDDDSAYFGRWCPIPFDNAVPESQQDRYLFDKLITPQELSGILNWALEGLYRLLEKGCFSYAYSPEQVRNLMIKSGNPLVSFAQEVLIEQPGNKITKEKMYEIYTSWSKKSNVSRLSKEQLGRRLEVVTKFAEGRTGAKERYWANVGLQSEKLKELCVSIDTLDTSQKIIRDMGIKNTIIIDIIKKDVSNPSKSEPVKTEEKPSEIDEDFLTE